MPMVKEFTDMIVESELAAIFGHKYLKHRVLYSHYGK
jgi:hypothetical protein